VTAPVQRPTPAAAITDLHKRVRALEGTQAGGLDAVRFNDKNTELALRYLIVVANEDIPTTDNSIHIESAGAVGDFEIVAKGNLTLDGDQIQLSAPNPIVLFGAGEIIRLDSTEILLDSVATSIKSSSSGPSGAGIYLETANGYDLKMVVDGDYVLSGTGVFGLSTDSTITLATTSSDINLGPAGALNALAPSGIFLNLPLAPGTSGSLYSNGGVVTVSP